MYQKTGFSDYLYFVSFQKDVLQQWMDEKVEKRWCAATFPGILIVLIQEVNRIGLLVF